MKLADRRAVVDEMSTVVLMLFRLGMRDSEGVRRPIIKKRDMARLLDLAANEMNDRWESRTKFTGAEDDDGFPADVSPDSRLLNPINTRRRLGGRGSSRGFRL